jgi:hypothetical protein
MPKIFTTRLTRSRLPTADLILDNMRMPTNAAASYPCSTVKSFPTFPFIVDCDPAFVPAMSRRLPAGTALTKLTRELGSRSGAKMMPSEGFTEPGLVINGFSDLFVAVLGEARLQACGVVGRRGEPRVQYTCRGGGYRRGRMTKRLRLADPLLETTRRMSGGRLSFLGRYRPTTSRNDRALMEEI